MERQNEKWFAQGHLANLLWEHPTLKLRSCDSCSRARPRKSVAPNPCRCLRSGCSGAQQADLPLRRSASQRGGSPPRGQIQSYPIRHSHRLGRSQDNKAAVSHLHPAWRSVLEIHSLIKPLSSQQQHKQRCDISVSHVNLLKIQNLIPARP